MLIQFRKKIAAVISPERARDLIQLEKDLGELARNIDLETNRRVAELVSKMDPYEPLMRSFNSIFSEDYSRPEDKLDEPSKMAMYMLGYRWTEDPSFNFLADWIINQHGNAVFKKPGVTKDNALDVLNFGKAQISTVVLLRKELGRLSSLYQEIMRKEENDMIISTSTVE